MSWICFAAPATRYTRFSTNVSVESRTRVFEACQSEQRILVTFDLDFADIRQYPPATHAGIWVLRPRHQDIKSTLELLKGALALLGDEPAAMRLWIVEHERVRIRQ